MASKRKDVFVIIESPTLQKPLWRKIGGAFVNRDGSLSVILDALPVSGRMHIRDPYDSAHQGSEDTIELEVSDELAEHIHAEAAKVMDR